MPEPSTARKLGCTVALNEPLAPGMQRVRLYCPELADSIEPGQFFNLYVPGDPSQILRLPFSWSAKDVERGEVEFAVLIVGDGTRRLSELPVGTPCDLLGPAGHGWLSRARPGQCAFAGCCGVVAEEGRSLPV